MIEPLKIRLRKDIEIENPEERIREYCDIEIYQGYDDQHSVDNQVTSNDIEAANNLFAMIGRYDPNESRRILNSPNISVLLGRVGYSDLSTMSDAEWSSEKENIRLLLKEWLSIPGIGLAKAAKIIHLKRPKVFPILDSYVIKFLTGINVADIFDKTRILEVGMNALETSRSIILQNRDAFSKLQQRLSDLPIPLTTVRLLDILCWTTEKWEIRGNRKAAYGIASKSLRTDESKPSVDISSGVKEFSYWMNVDKPTKKCTIHVQGCPYELKCNKETPFKGVGKLKRDGGWLSFPSLEEARAYFHKEWGRRGYKLSECKCLR